jgi:hypothetical protein
VVRRLANKKPGGTTPMKVCPPGDVSDLTVSAFREMKAERPSCCVYPVRGETTAETTRRSIAQDRTAVKSPWFRFAGTMDETGRPRRVQRNRRSVAQRPDIVKSLGFTSPVSRSWVVADQEHHSQPTQCSTVINVCQITGFPRSHREELGRCRPGTSLATRRSITRSIVLVKRG